MSHKFRVVFGKRRYCPYPTGIEYCDIKYIIPPWKSLRFCTSFRRGFVGGLVCIGDYIQFTFPLPFKSIKGKGKMIERLIKEKNGKATQ